MILLVWNLVTYRVKPIVNILRVLSTASTRPLPVGESLSDAPFFGLCLYAEFQPAKCACTSGWSSILGYPTSNSWFWESKGLWKVNAVTICIASLMMSLCADVHAPKGADNKLVSCYYHKQDLLSQERKRVGWTAYASCVLPQNMVCSDHVTVSCHMTHLYVNILV